MLLGHTKIDCVLAYGMIEPRKLGGAFGLPKSSAWLRGGSVSS